MQETHRVSIVRGCAALSLARSEYYHVPRDWQVRDAEVIEALNQLVEAHPRWGVWKYIDRLRAPSRPNKNSG